MKDYDFAGWATRNGLKCSDGRTIAKDAFKHNDGSTVPLVWNHQHNDPLNVLGHAELENRESGVYAYCKFNDTEAGRNAKLLVEHGDIQALSIHANHLKQQGGTVLHGSIREVSLVLAGANPGAFIDSIMQHGEESEEEAIIYTGEELEHACKPKKKKSLEHIEDPEDKKEEIPDAKKEGDKKMDNEKTVQDVIDSMSEEQKNVMYALIGQALEDNQGGDKDMKHNVFENENDVITTGGELTHDDMQTILTDAKRYGSLKESFLQHADEFGIQDIEWLFPEAKNLNNPPEFIKRPDGWVSTVMGS